MSAAATTIANDRIAIELGEDGVADVRLMRADKMNALDPEMFQRIIEAGHALQRMKGLRAVVLSGEGRAFCAGLDLSSLSNDRDPGASSAGGSLSDRTRGIVNNAQYAAWGWREIPVPVIAAVHGVAFGAGSQIMAAADIRIVHPETRLAIMEMKWGLVPDMGGYALWRGLVRDDVLRELIYTNREFTGAEAQTLGLATYVDENPRERALAIARQIALKNPHAIRAAREVAEAKDKTRAALASELAAQLVQIVSSPNQASKSYITDQYDRYVGGNTALAQPDDSGMIRVSEESGLGISLATDANGRYCYLDPYQGARLALAEAYRNVAVSGATPVAVTNCLNFGSPENPEVMWQFKQATAGLADGCLELGIPVTGGNVSFYNQTGDVAIHPTPVVGVLGVIDDVARRIPSGWQDAGHNIYLLGHTRDDLDGSVWADVIHGHLGGRPPILKLDEERALAEERKRLQEQAAAAQKDAVRRDRNLMMRFPDEAAHNKAREAALDDLRRGIAYAEEKRSKLLSLRDNQHKFIPAHPGCQRMLKARSKPQTDALRCQIQDRPKLFV